MSDTPKTNRIADYIRMAIAANDSLDAGDYNDEAIKLADQLETELIAANERVKELEKERDDADRRAGAAERQNAWLNDAAFRREKWLDEAKDAWGVRRGVSFDVVWDECLKLKPELNASKQREAKLREALEMIIRIHSNTDSENDEDGLPDIHECAASALAEMEGK